MILPHSSKNLFPVSSCTQTHRHRPVEAHCRYSITLWECCKTTIYAYASVVRWNVFFVLGFFFTMVVTWIFPRRVCVWFCKSTNAYLGLVCICVDTYPPASQIIVAHQGWGNEVFCASKHSHVKCSRKLEAHVAPGMYVDVCWAVGRVGWVVMRFLDRGMIPVNVSVFFFVYSRNLPQNEVGGNVKNVPTLIWARFIGKPGSGTTLTSDGSGIILHPRICEIYVRKATKMSISYLMSFIYTSM